MSVGFAPHTLPGSQLSHMARARSMDLPDQVDLIVLGTGIQEALLAA